jgi:hypothetical protein
MTEAKKGRIREDAPHPGQLLPDQKMNLAPIWMRRG